MADTGAAREIVGGGEMRGVGSHFQIDVAGVRIAYLYIRKNACTSWKRLFLQESEAREQRAACASNMEFMRRYHHVSRLRDLKKIPHRIVVVRDPVDRLVSGFVNKLVIGLNRDTRVRRDVEEATGVAARELSFEGFVNEYIRPKESLDLNPHFVLQADHLSPMRYTEIWPLGRLTESAGKLFGESVAERYFGRPVNSTRGRPVDERSVGGVKLDILHRNWRKNGVLPDRRALVNAAVERDLEEYYQRDIALYERATRESGAAVSG